LSWSPVGDSLAIVDKTSPRDAQSIFVLSLHTLKLRRITHPPAAQSWGDISPTFSPDGRSLAFVRWTTTASDVFVTPVDGGEARRVTTDRRILMSVDWMAGGEQLVFSSDRVGSGGIWTIPASGGHARLLAAVAGISFVSASRRAKQLAYADLGLFEDSNIWQIDLTKPADPPARLIASTKLDITADFSPDGNRIVFNSTRSGTFEIWMCDRDCRHPVQLTNFAGPHAGSPRWSPDAMTIAFDAQSKNSSDGDIYVTDVDSRIPRQLTTENSEDIVPCWSEDGRTIYFGSTRSGDWQLWKMPAHGGAALQVTRAGGAMAVGVDSGFVYYLKSMVARIWRVPEQGGREEAVLETPEFHYSRYCRYSRRHLLPRSPASTSCAEDDQLLQLCDKTGDAHRHDGGQAARLGAWHLRFAGWKMDAVHASG
jgi:Tol biopolymer transport system component